MSKGLRWLSALAALALLFALLIGTAIAFAWSALPLDQATIVIDGETVSLPRLEGWQAALALALAVLAVLVAAIVAAAGVVVVIAAGVLGTGIAAIAVIATLLLITWPLLLAGWLVWRLTRGPAKGVARPELA